LRVERSTFGGMPHPLEQLRDDALRELESAPNEQSL
jgi:hypothetical protein